MHGNQLLRLCNSFLKRQPAYIRTLLMLMLSLVIACIDIATPPYVLFIGFYLVPIFLATWFCGKKTMGIVLVISILANTYDTGLNYPSTAPYWEIVFTQASVSLVFLAFTWLMRALRQAFERIDQESRTDYLTGLRNRRSFMETLEAEIARAQRMPHPFAIAIIDLDNFKLINDTHGHLKGDEALIAVAGCLRTCLRKEDTIGRYGGDEFAVLLPRVSENEALTLLNRLHSKLVHEVCRFNPESGASIGVALVLPETAVTLSSFIKQVDDALYSVKRSRKNDVALITL